ncbi:MAG: restriction endonuclease [Armatimonadetes bacterium]|nr:restriction endonuclease [Armatimonadota bacterium]
MATDEEYRDFVCTLDHPALVALWEDIRASRTPAKWPDQEGWDRGKGLEYCILQGFALEAPGQVPVAADVVWPFSVLLGDLGESGTSLRSTEAEQIDGVIHLDGLSCLVEAKAESEPVAIAPLAKMRSQLLRRPATTIGAIFSLNDFTEPAKRLAAFMFPQTVLLWTGKDMHLALRHQRLFEGLRAKFRMAVEKGLPLLALEALWPSACAEP